MNNWQEIREEMLVSDLSDYKSYVDVTDHIRVYLSPKGNGNGFDFCVVEVISYRDEIWAPDSECEFIVSEGNAMFDGIRHIYFGDEGYIHYPNLESISDIMKTLQHLVEEHCKES